MIIPSIDLMDGQSVQLIGGEATSRSDERSYGDPIPLIRKFRLAGDVAVIDLDRALGRGDNREVVKRLCREANCRVGGGIRSAADAIEMLDAGAKQVILGTAAKPEILSGLPKHRVLAALDGKHGDVVVEGWTKSTGTKILDRVKELRDYVGGFLVTFVEREGRLGGTDMELARQIVEAAGKAKVTIAGGVTTIEEIAELHDMGADAQVGMALYTGQMDLGDAISCVFKTDRPDGLFSTVVTDERGIALGLAYSSKDSIREAVKRQLGVYQSRKRGLWVKGETSGSTQDLLAIVTDCDDDAIQFKVHQHGSGYCHLPQFTCFGDEGGLTELERTLNKRKTAAPEGSYTKRLFHDAALLKAKLVEEANELATAQTPDEVTAEAADVLYFTMVKLAAAGVSLAQVEEELNRRALKVTRRPGDAKPAAKE